MLTHQDARALKERQAQVWTMEFPLLDPDRLHPGTLLCSCNTLCHLLSHLSSVHSYGSEERSEFLGDPMRQLEVQERESTFIQGTA